MKEVYPESKANVEFRKFVSKYLKGMEHIKELKLKMTTALNLAELVRLIEENL